MYFEESVRDLESRKESRINLGLSRLRAVLARLGNPQDKIRVIHAAGTNAKGSVCRMLAAAFSEAGYSAGLYTSPHLYSPRERIEIAGRSISKRDFARFYQRVRKTPGQEKLSYFEMITALAFVYFHEKKADPVILETGLGGRLDATNMPEKPLLSLITSIGMDHMDWLGNTIQKIAAEKGGIFKRGVPALVGAVPKEAEQVLREIAREKGAPVRFIKSGLKPVSVDWKRGVQTFKWRGKKLKLPMAGVSQRKNVKLVLEALKVLNPALSISLAKAKQPARWEIRFLKGKPWVFDVAHNAQAVEAFLETLRVSPWSKTRPKLAVVGFLKDKDYPAMLSLLKPHFDEFIVVQLEGERAAPASDVLKNIGRGFIAASIKDAVELARLRKAGFTAFLGSFRIAAPALRSL